MKYFNTDGTCKPDIRDERRTFLKKSALAAVAPMFVPAAIFGKNAPSNRITIGMIGTGRQGVNPNLAQFLKQTDAQVVAVCDVDRWRMAEARRQVDAAYSQRFGKDYQGCREHADFREILARRDVDAVMISTPDFWHVPMGVLAARAGKHFAIEKPLSISIAQGRALAAEVKQHGVITRIDSEFRSLRPFNRLVELARNGRLGKIHTVRIGLPTETEPVPPQPDMPVPPELDYEMWLGPMPRVPYTEKRVHGRHDLKARPNWMRISDYANGMIANWGAHLFDVAQWALDTETTGPVAVTGKGEFSQGLWNTIRTFEITYTYANGIVMTARTDKPYLRLEGSEGWAQTDYPNTFTASRPEWLSYRAEKGELDLSGTLEDKADFLQAVRTGQPSLEPIEIGHRTITIAQMGLIAATLGYPLKWDPAAERFNDNAANAMAKGPELRAPWNVI